MDDRFLPVTREEMLERGGILVILYMYVGMLM